MKAIFFIVILGILTTGCKSFDQVPEVRDEIYQDLVTQLEDAERQLGDKQTNIDLTQTKLDELVSDPKQFRKLRTRIIKDKKDLYMLQQEVTFLRLRVRSRKIAVRDQYLEAWKNDEEWPNQEVYTYYHKNIELRKAPRTWMRGSRVTPF